MIWGVEVDEADGKMRIESSAGSKRKGVVSDTGLEPAALIIAHWQEASDLLLEAVDDRETGFGNLENGIPFLLLGEELHREQVREERVGRRGESSLRATYVRELVVGI